MAHVPSIVDDVAAEVLQQTLVEIFMVLSQRSGRLDRPTAFLRWARVILFRRLSRYMAWSRRGNFLSLETQPEALLERLIDRHGPDPVEAIIQGETQKELKKAILVLKNPHYQQVLLSTYIAGEEERELAQRWQVQVQDIYLWRARALKALRKVITQGDGSH